ncbi:MAG: hypothetical protein LBP70_01675 [Mycoplasmataceae bacterium]|nr:hypothetical protein [Mycoplasmataceae bacterium]
MTKIINKHNIIGLTDSKPRNIVALVFNIVAIVFFGIGIILFFSSSIVRIANMDPDSQVLSSFGFSTSYAIAGIVFVTIGYSLFQWATFLKTSYKLTNSRSLTLIILNSSFLILGISVMAAASPNPRDAYDGTACFVASLFATLFLATAFIINLVFNHIHYKQSLTLSIWLVIILFLGWIIAAVLTWKEDVNLIANKFSSIFQIVSLLAFWFLIIIFLKNNILNKSVKRYTGCIRATLVLLWIYFGICVIHSLILLISAFVSKISFDTVFDVAGLWEGIVLTAMLIVLTIAFSANLSSSNNKPTNKSVSQKTN